MILGGAAVWFLTRPNPDMSPAESRFRSEASNAIAAAGTAGYHLTEAAKAKLESLDLRPEQISEELARTGKVVRRRARDLGDQVADAATDVRITTSIKAKLALDSELSAQSISVTTSQRHVTLSGTVSSPEAIGKAIALALEIDGVQEVTSTIQPETKK